MKKSVLTFLLLGTVFLTGCGTVVSKTKAQSSASPTSAKTVAPTRAVKVMKKPVVVFGGGVSGVAAAVAAARLGTPVLLVVRHQMLGGTMTVGELNTIDMNYGLGHRVVTQGLFMHFFKRIGYHSSFNVKTAVKALDAMVNKSHHITVWYNATPQKVGRTGSVIRYVDVRYKGKIWRLEASRFIDAGPNGTVAALAKVPYTIGWQGTGLGPVMQAPTLVFALRGVNWPQVQAYLRKRRAVDGYDGATNTSAQGYAFTDAQYKPINPNMKFRGMNLGLQQNGTVLVNALWIFGVNGLSHSSRQRAIAAAKKEIPHIVSFLRTHAVGFSHAQLAGYAQELYLRETRHFQGLTTLTAEDVLGNRSFWDLIGWGSYPMDVQAAGPTGSGDAFGNPIQYSIPFRALVPTHVSNLLIVNRAASYNAVAAGAARVLPVGVVEGQAAGVAAVMSLASHMNFPAFAHSRQEIGKLQSKLRQQGAYLPTLHIHTALSSNWAFPFLAHMVNHMMVTGGYQNQFLLNHPMPGSLFAHLLSIDNWFVPAQKRSKLHPVSVALPPTLTVDEAATAILQAMGKTAGKQPLAQLIKGKWLSPLAISHLHGQAVLTRGDAYALLVSLGDVLRGSKFPRAFSAVGSPKAKVSSATTG